jgi:diguanylate cyclase (GGDEF)-like protein
MDSGRHVRSGRRLALLTAIFASFAAVTALRFAVDDPNEAIGFLFGVPISIAAAEFSWRGALASAGAAMGLTALWAVLEQVPFETIGTRIALFAVVGLVIGVQVEKSRRLEAERERLLAELHRLAMLDQLTGVANRRSWDERFATELRQAARGEHELVLVAVDLDGLKHVNDTLGHESGDRLIRAAAASLADGIRETDFLARVGGDEFLILLPRCTPGDAARLLERVIADAPPGHGFSAGIAAWDGHEHGLELIGRADRALYRAKAAGGAAVECAPGGDAAVLPGA